MSGNDDQTQVVSIADRRAAMDAAASIPAAPSPDPQPDPVVAEKAQDKALEAMSTEDKRAAAEKALTSARQVWGLFEKTMQESRGRAERWLISAALVALDHIIAEGLGQLWAEMGIAVQTARTTQRATLEMGGETARALLALDERLRALETAQAKPLELVALRRVLTAFDAEPPPRDLPEGSTNDHPLKPQP